MQQIKSQNRLLWLDCLKSFSTLLIIMQHSISYEWVHLLTENNVIWKIINFVFMISKSGVPIFIMCSGIGMLQKERSIKDIFTKNVYGILKCYICWMLIYGLYHVYSLFVQDLATVRTVINAIIKDIIFGQYHTWFITTLLALYLITPFLQLIIKNKLLTQYFLILAFIYTIVFPYIGKYDFLSRLYTVIKDMNMNFVVGYSLYFVLGYYLANLKITIKLKILIPTILILSTISAFIISNNLAVTQGAACQNTFTEFSFLGFTICVSILLLFRIILEHACANLSHARISDKLVNTLANLSYLGIGIYLLHPLLLFIVDDYKGLKCLFGGFLLWGISFSIVKLISFLPIRTLFLGK